MIRRDLRQREVLLEQRRAARRHRAGRRRLPGALVGERGLDPVPRVAGHVRQPELATEPDRGVVDRLEQQPGPHGHLVALGAGLAALVAGLLLELRDLRPELAELTLQPGRGLLGATPGRLGLLAGGALLGAGLPERAPQGGHLGLQRVQRRLVAAPHLAQRPVGLVGALAQPLLLLAPVARLGGPLGDAAYGVLPALGALQPGQRGHVPRRLRWPGPGPGPRPAPAARRRARART